MNDSKISDDEWALRRRVASFIRRVVKADEDGFRYETNQREREDCRVMAEILDKLTTHNQP